MAVRSCILCCHGKAQANAASLRWLLLLCHYQVLHSVDSQGAGVGPAKAPLVCASVPDSCGALVWPAMTHTLCDPTRLLHMQVHNRNQATHHYYTTCQCLTEVIAKTQARAQPLPITPADGWAHKADSGACQQLQRTKQK